MIKTEAIQDELFIKNISLQDLDKVEELNVSAVDIAGDFSPVFLDDLLNFTELKKLKLVSVTLTEEDIQNLKSLKKLKSLELFDCNLPQTYNFSELEELSIVRGEGFCLDKIANTNLKSLSIVGMDINNLNAIETNNIIKMRVVSNDASEFVLPSKLDSLQSLDVSFSKVSNLSSIVLYKNIKTLVVDRKQAVMEKSTLNMILSRKNNLVLLDEFFMPLDMEDKLNDL
ncbi:MAG: hypothetical protein R3Y43_02505 [Alphaproteobacteria bacterium]